MGAKILTDESVAKALGWLSLKGYPKWQMRAPDGEIRNCPNFTTSLDAIVAEIEERGLFWSVDHEPNPDLKSIQGDSKAVVQRYGAHGKTAPLALCAALLTYLKEGKP